jgi:WD40 repeat protein
MKALEKDRTRRYETANGFAADVMRHLANEPVVAAPPSRVYRMRKFVRKHRGGVIAAGLVLLALIGGITGTTLGLFEARKQEKIASGERDRAVEAGIAAVKAAEKETAERKRAVKAEAETEKKADELAHQLDNSNFLLAAAAYDNRDASLARLRLNGIQAKNRGWEWRYLRRQSIGGIFTLYGVTSAAFSRDGSRIFTGSNDGTKVWDARTGTELKGEPIPAELRSDRISPDGTRIVTGGENGTAKVVDARTGTPQLVLKKNGFTPWCMAFSPDGTRIVTGGAGTGREIVMWDAITGTPLFELNGNLKGHEVAVRSVAFSPDSTKIVTSGRQGDTAKVWDARTGVHLLDLEAQGAYMILSVAFSPDGTRIVTGNRNRTVKVWDTRTGTLLLDLTGHTDWVTSVAFSPDGTRIVSCSSDGSAKVWDARTDSPRLELKGHTDKVSSVAFSPDGTRIVTGSWDQTAKVWDARTETPLLDLKGHTARVTNVSFSPELRVYGLYMVPGARDHVRNHEDRQPDSTPRRPPD